MLTGDNYHQIINVAVIGLLLCIVVILLPARLLDQENLANLK